MVLTTILANLLSTGCAVLLVRRGPSPRLRLLTMVVGLASLSQTAAFLHAQGIWQIGTGITTLHQLLVGALSLCAIHLLSREIRDRNLTDRKLRLTEHELVVLQNRAQQPVAKVAPPPPPAIPEEYRATVGLLSLFSALNENRGLALPSPSPDVSNLPAVRGPVTYVRRRR